MKWAFLFAFIMLNGHLAAQTPAVTPPTILTAVEISDLQKIRNYYAEGDYETALSLCQNAVFEDPNDWQAYAQMALCYKALGKEDKAAAADEKARELNPTMPAPGVVRKKRSHKLRPAPNPQASTLAPPDLPLLPKLKKDNQYTLNLKIGYVEDYANLSNLDTSASLWNASLLEVSGIGNANLSHLGFGATAELSWGLGQTEAIALRMSYSGGHVFSESYSYGGYSESQIIDPQLFTLGLDYYQYFPESFGRFFICGGGTLGQAVVEVSTVTPLDTITGTLGGTGFGGEIGLGNEFNLDPNTSMEFSIRYQALIVSQVETSYTDNYGNTGELTLAQNAGQVFLTDTRTIGGATTYAPLDFSGVLIGFSLNWRVL